MAGQNIILSESMTAAADLSSYQYSFVKLTDDRTVNLCGSGEAPYGILQNAPESGEQANVATLGISNLKANAAITVGAKVGSGAAGGLGAAVTGDDEYYGAVAREAATAQNDIISVLLCPGAPTVSAAGDD